MSKRWREIKIERPVAAIQLYGFKGSQIRLQRRGSQEVLVIRPKSAPWLSGRIKGSRIEYKRARIVAGWESALNACKRGKRERATRLYLKRLRGKVSRGTLYNWRRVMRAVGIAGLIDGRSGRQAKLRAKGLWAGGVLVL